MLIVHPEEIKAQRQAIIVSLQKSVEHVIVDTVVGRSTEQNNSTLHYLQELNRVGPLACVHILSGTWSQGSTTEVPSVREMPHGSLQLSWSRLQGSSAQSGSRNRGEAGSLPQMRSTRHVVFPRRKLHGCTSGRL